MTKRKNLAQVEYPEYSLNLICLSSSLSTGSVNCRFTTSQTDTSAALATGAEHGGIPSYIC